MTIDIDGHFSRRLDWCQPRNALADAERLRRDAGLLVRDLTASNPTLIFLEEAGGSSDPQRAVSEAGLAPLPAAFARALTLPYDPHPRGLPSARDAVAQNYAAEGTQIDPDDIILTASSSESYGFLWKLLCDPGDTVLVPEPSYPLFDYLARLDGVTTLAYRLDHDGTRTGRWSVNLDSVDEALARATSPVRALVVVSPNNPTGSVLDRSELAALDERARTRGFSIVADEVFCDYLVRRRPEQVMCAAAEPTRSLTFSLGGLSKSGGLPHVKLGWLAVGGAPALVRSAIDRLDIIADTYLSLATPVQVVLPELLRLGKTRRLAIQRRLATNRATLEEIFAPPSPASVIGSDGGWAAILRLPAVMSDEDWALCFLREDGILAHPGYFFDLRAFTGVVVSLLPPPALFRAAARDLRERVVALLPR